MEEDIDIIKASEIRTREIEWLWYPFIPYGKVTVLQGDSGEAVFREELARHSYCLIKQYIEDISHRQHMTAAGRPDDGY